MILSTSSTKVYTCLTAPRVSASHSTSRISYSVKSGCGGARRLSRPSCLLFCASKLWGMAEMLNERKNSSSSAAAAAVVVASSSASDRHEISPPRSFIDARTEQDLLLGIQKEAEAGRLPINVAQGMAELYHSYRNAVFQSGHPKPEEIVLSNMAVVLDRIFLDVRDPFQFLPYHSAIREPFDYYMFGQKYIRPLLDFRNILLRIVCKFYFLRSKKLIFPRACSLDSILLRTSFLGNISLFNEIEKKLEQDSLFFRQNKYINRKSFIECLRNHAVLPNNASKYYDGENVILVSNHQTEADPAVIALLLESTSPFIAENLIFVAGDRVITDPLCKPFSMGRNLLCVYSKKHMNDDPQLIDMKKRANTKSLKEMALLLRGGSKIIWIAPSGGRDRPDPVTKEWHPAPFDASSVDNMRRLAEHAGIPGHIYPLAILCHEIMPPPLKVEKEIGERRVISFHGVGLSVAPSINYHKIASALEDPEEAKIAYTELLYASVCKQYNVLKSAIHGKQGLKASTPSVSLAQPWQ